MEQGELDGVIVVVVVVPASWVNHAYCCMMSIRFYTFLGYSLVLLGSMVVALSLWYSGAGPLPGDSNILDT